MSYNYNATKKRFYTNLTIATNENQKLDWVTFSKDTTTNTYSYRS